MSKWREQFITEAERTKTNKPEMEWHRREVFKWKIAAFEHKAKEIGPCKARFCACLAYCIMLRYQFEKLGPEFE